MVGADGARFGSACHLFTIWSASDEQDLGRACLSRPSTPGFSAPTPQLRMPPTSGSDVRCGQEPSGGGGAADFAATAA